MRKYQTIIVDYKNQTTDEFLDFLSFLNDDGNFFIRYFVNEKNNKNVFKLIKNLSNQFHFVNLIVVPSNEGDIQKFYYIIWFSKNKKYYFDKNTIREKHIWKNVEWGKRKKNYNSRGKDPGNVWLLTKDDGKGHITKHIVLNTKDVVNRILSSTLKSTNDNILLSGEFTDNYNYHNINLDYFKTVKNDSIKFNWLFPKKVKTTSQKKHNVYFDTSENIKKFKDVQLIVTSPPYWDLKNYYKEGQLGKEPYESYLKRMNFIWEKCINILNQDGTIAININLRRKNNQPINIPSDIIDFMIKKGLHYHGEYIWHKSSGIPVHEKNIVDRHEYILIFSKSSVLNLNPDFFSKIKDYKNMNINFGNLWNINRKAGSVGKKFIHPAIYPTEMINRLISLFTHKGDIVFDPFLGSGTTLISSILMERKFIGYEYNEGFADLIKERVKNETIVDSKINFLQG